MESNDCISELYDSGKITEGDLYEIIEDIENFAIDGFNDCESVVSELKVKITDVGFRNLIIRNKAGMLLKYFEMFGNFDTDSEKQYLAAIRDLVHEIMLLTESKDK